jgi:hypothetical protein
MWWARLALGCKNEANPLDTIAVDSFVGILTEVGIPLQHGILVSAKGYTRDALDAVPSGKWLELGVAHSPGT